MSRLARFIPLSTLLVLASCGHQDRSAPASPDARERERTITLELRVESAARAAASLTALATRHHGYVHASTIGERGADYELRVPVRELAAFRRAARRLGSVANETEQAEDVTDHHRDVSARLRNARREEARLLALMDERAGSLADVIAIEEHLGTVRERVEQLDAEERAIAQRVENAVVHVQLSPRRVPFWERPGETISVAARSGVTAVQAIVVGSAAAIAGLGPSLLLLALALVALVYLLRRIGRRSRSAEPSALG